MLAAGMDKREADVRLTSLDALEHTPLAVGCCGAAIYLLAAGRTDPPPLDFVWSWAVGPLLGAALVIPAVIRYRDRFRNAPGFRHYHGIGLESVALLGRLSTLDGIAGDAVSVRNMCHSHNSDWDFSAFRRQRVRLGSRGAPSGPR